MGETGGGRGWGANRCLCSKPDAAAVTTDDALGQEECRSTQRCHWIGWPTDLEEGILIPGYP